MKSPLFPAAGALLLLALLLTLHVLLSAPAYHDRLDRRTKALNELRRLRSVRQPVLDRLSALPDGYDFAATLQALAAEKLGQEAPRFEFEAPAALPPYDASVHAATLRVDDAFFTDVAAFLDALPTLVPPCHVDSASFQSSSAPGKGTATLRLLSL